MDGDVDLILLLRKGEELLVRIKNDTWAEVWSTYALSKGTSAGKVGVVASTFGRDGDQSLLESLFP